MLKSIGTLPGWVQEGEVFFSKVKGTPKGRIFYAPTGELAEESVAVCRQIEMGMIGGLPLSKVKRGCKSGSLAIVEFETDSCFGKVAHSFGFASGKQGIAIEIRCFKQK
jgi:hypothetical protein